MADTPSTADVEAALDSLALEVHADVLAAREIARMVDGAVR